MVVEQSASNVNRLATKFIEAIKQHRFFSERIRRWCLRKALGEARHYGYSNLMCIINWAVHQHHPPRCLHSPGVAMRTTLDLDDDVLLAARELARSGTSPSGKRSRRWHVKARPVLTFSSVRNGVPLFPSVSSGTIVTLELVNQLRDEAP